jgi:DNA-binding transcriptional LysR family regulator
MELRHLRYFLAVASEQHMRKASQSLRIAQPAVTRQIADLEREIGCPLFERLPRGVRLNAAGKAFLAETKQILASVESAVRIARNASKGVVGALRVGFIDAAAWAGIFPNVVHAYRKEAPLVMLELVPMTSRQQLLSIEAGELDCGFCYQFEQIPGPCSSRTLRADHVALAAPRRYGWRKRRRTLLKHLINEPFVAIKRSSAPVYVDTIMAASWKGGFSPRVVQEAIDETTMLSLVSAGIGIGFVNSANAARKPDGVDFVKVHDLKVELPLCLVWKTNNPLPTLRHFLEITARLAGVPI